MISLGPLGAFGGPASWPLRISGNFLAGRRLQAAPVRAADLAPVFSATSRGGACTGLSAGNRGAASGSAIGFSRRAGVAELVPVVPRGISGAIRGSGSHTSHWQIR